mmetsp:Transcript_19035/g.26559  ORF Transcript_19035/g.26559 Transcript_19035/m.26559 type:complete len:197 (+) Transcript_19035:85-675(+)
MRKSRNGSSPYAPLASQKSAKKRLDSEELGADILRIKRLNMRLRQENKELRTTVQRLTHQVKRKDRSIYRVLSLTPEHSESTPRLLQEIKSDLISLPSLNERIQSLEEQIKKTEGELQDVTTSTKYTRIRELQLESQVYAEEGKRITDILDQLIGPSRTINTSRSARPASARRPKVSSLAKSGSQTSRRHRPRNQR